MPPLVEKVCQKCGEPFRRVQQARYCCDECRVAAQVERRQQGKTQLRERQCASCPNRFTPKRRNHRCCSAKCRVYHHRYMKRYG